MHPKDPTPLHGAKPEPAATDALDVQLHQSKREGRAVKRVLLTGLAVALFYGILARLTFGLGASSAPVGEQGGAWYMAFSIMTVAFLFGVPFVMGFAVVYLGKIHNFLRALWVPQIAALAALALALVFTIEGLICVVFWLPAYVTLTAAGGAAAYLVVRVRKNRDAFLGMVFLLPYGAAIVEHELPAELQVRRVETHIDVEAPVAAVWEEIVDVPLITESEHGFAWSHVIGFPRPVSARTSERSLGALREARFERGVVFYERVTRYEPNSALEFDITVDQRSIPEDALDEHVTLGGPYFDVLHGAYRIEPLSNGRVRLHLSSDHRLSTHFNGYAAWWTDFVMRDTQNYILEIVARRAETCAN
jgi:hypothetical protein